MVNCHSVSVTNHLRNWPHCKNTNLQWLNNIWTLYLWVARQVSPLSLPSFATSLYKCKSLNLTIINLPVLKRWSLAVPWRNFWTAFPWPDKRPTVVYKKSTDCYCIFYVSDSSILDNDPFNSSTVYMYRYHMQWITDEKDGQLKFTP